MAGLLPASVYGLRVPAGGIPIPGEMKFPASFRITMAAIDPSAEPQIDEENKVPRATLRLIREPLDDDSDDESFSSDPSIEPDDIEAIRARLGDALSDEDMSDDDEDDSESEANGGPSDPAKTKEAKRAALANKLREALEEEMEIDSLTNGARSKGKARALDDEDISIDSEDEEQEPEEFVICTLDPNTNWQQPIDITVGEHESVYFQVNGTHDIYLTGNYVLPPDMDMSDEDDDDDYDEEDEMDYDLSPDEDELDLESESEDDELDGLDDPRITEVDSEEEAPKLVKTDKKGKNKRQADSDEEEATLDALISKNKADAPATNGEKLSKKQAKKLKKNDGEAAAVEPATNGDKKTVKFAKNLELGPTGSPKVTEAKKEEPKKDDAKSGPRIVQGVTVEDKKTGKGRAAKKGDKIEMRYIGKLKNGKQFDANKKGKPFAFKLGVGEVIKGWDVGVAGMTAGGERRLTIPASLAYGKKALPGIPANSDLVFDIKCISVQ